MGLLDAKKVHQYKKEIESCIISTNKNKSIDKLVLWLFNNFNDCQNEMEGIMNVWDNDDTCKTRESTEDGMDRLHWHAPRTENEYNLFENKEKILS